MAKSKEVMTVRDVAEYLDVHPMTIYKYVQEGRIPAFKIGASWRISKASIQRWINENERQRKESA